MIKIKLIVFIIFIISFISIFLKNGYYYRDLEGGRNPQTKIIVDGEKNEIKDCNLNPFVSEKNEFIDCGKVCGNNEYGHVFVETNNYINVENRIFYTGSYCVPKNVLYCNLKTSNLIKISDKWECRPKWGEIFDNDVIKVCNGYLYDNKYKTVYDFKLPKDVDLTQEGPHEYLEDAVPRFLCADEVFVKESKYAILDGRKNHKIRAEFSPFSRIINSCALLLNNINNSQIRPNFVDGICDCSPEYNERLDSEDILQRVCSPCLNNKLYKSAEGIHYPITSRACVKSYDFDIHYDSRISLVNKIPCGKNTFTVKSGACLEGKLLVDKNISQYAQKILQNI